MDQEVTLRLTPEEINFIFMTLNELPTKSGAYPLTLKIKRQGEEQMAQYQKQVGATQ